MKVPKLRSERLDNLLKNHQKRFYSHPPKENKKKEKNFTVFSVDTLFVAEVLIRDFLFLINPLRSATISYFSAPICREKSSPASDHKFVFAGINSIDHEFPFREEEDSRRSVPT